MGRVSCASSSRHSGTRSQLARSWRQLASVRLGEVSSRVGCWLATSSRSTPASSGGARCCSTDRVRCRLRASSRGKRCTRVA